MKQSYEEEPMISVIIPVYNVHDYLDRCLESVVENDYRNLEIICIDDGSTDGCDELLRKWSRKDDRIQIISTANQGLSEARNTGIRAATAEYVAFVDSDDYIHPKYFTILLSGLLWNKADVSVCSFRCVSPNIEVDFADIEEDDVQWRTIDRDHYLNLGKKKYSAWAKLYRKKLITVEFDRRFIVGEDHVFNLNIVQNNREINYAVSDCELYFYVSRSGSITHSFEIVQYNVIIYFADQIEMCFLNEDYVGQSIFLETALKKWLSYRYAHMFVDEDDKEKHAFTQRLLKLTLTRRGVLRIYKVLVYSAFLLFPSLYRLFRICNDPSMRKWELKMKRRSHLQAEGAD